MKRRAAVLWAVWLGRSEGAPVQHAVEGRPADAEHACGANLVAVDAGQNTRDVTQDRAIEIGVFDGKIGVRRRNNRRRPGKPRYVDGPDSLARCLQRCGGQNGFQLADVAGPLITSDAREGARGESPQRLAVARAPVPHI